MTINYNVTGTERKRLTDYISGFMGTDKKYLGAPTFAYQIGYLTVSKDGAVSFEDRGYNSDIDALMAELEGQGFHTEDTIAKADTAEPEAVPAKEGVTQPHGCGLTVTLPADSLSPDAQANLTGRSQAFSRCGGQPFPGCPGQPHQPPRRQGTAHPQGPGRGVPPGGGQRRHGFLPLVREPGPRCR